MSTDVVEGVVTDATHEQDEPGLPELNAQLAAMLAFQTELKSYVDDYRARVFAKMMEVKKQTGTKSFEHLYGEDTGVTFTIKATHSKIIVKHEQEFLDWVMEHHPSEVETIFQPREAWFKVFVKNLTGTEAGVFDGEGNEIPGLKWVKAPEPTSFGTSWKGDGKEAALADALANTGAGLLGIEAGQ